MATDNDWEQCNSETFWGEVAPCSHVLQLYEDDEALLNLLEDFAVGGFSVDDTVMVIATPEHLAELKRRLREDGLDLEKLCSSNKFIAISADEMLSRFMREGMPDEQLFIQAVTGVFDNVRNSKRHIRVFGEMVAILWEQNNREATIRLENMWNAFFEKESFALFCAYPKSEFSNEAASSLSCICSAHAKIISNVGAPRFDVSYQNTTTPGLRA
ncbi:MEDS domain-containing protein [Pontibacter sp. E15-1]|uniref:MEDS domain-containing protein n=1 Tax=Pontibacter sp. E15-1 TaxID=2919918 RepID=UPI001F4F1842|nr:MEDS domain-containing protein [Pontibacter sp. E15-1]MCJ8163364.1 MEDS domain-containing protein [Pontibacter sp. E15-1]